MRRYHARWLLPVTRPPVAEGTLVEEAGRIVYVGQRAGAPEGGEDIELGNSILMPGLVNVHTHLELTAMRGHLEELPFQPWIVTLTKSKREVLTREDLLDSARLGIREGLLAGITTFADTCESGVALPAMREAGVRGIMYQEVFGAAPQECDEAMAGLRAKVEAVRGLETPLVRVGISPHAPYSVADPLFSAAAAHARDTGLPMAIHIAESEDEMLLVREGRGAFAEAHARRGIRVAPRGRSPIALLETTGALSAGTLLIHCVRVDGEDLRRIAAAGATIAHCPASNAKLGHGVAPLYEMLEAGIPVGIGSDSVASNNRMDVIEETRLAVFLQRARLAREHVIPAATALTLATIGGARALRLEHEIGSLEIGKSADLAAFDMDSPRAVPTADPVSTAVFALSGADAKLVVVAGRILVRDRRVVADDAALPLRVQDSADALAAWRAAH